MFAALERFGLDKRPGADGAPGLSKNGSPGRTRTGDPAVNSRLLYQLSYRGSGSGAVIPEDFFTCQ